VANIVVTGGSRGIGLAIASTLAMAGFTVTAVSRSASEPLEAAMQAAPSLKACHWDLSDIASLPELAKTLRQTMGPIFGLVNNAGIGPAGILSTMPDRQIADLLALNVTSPITLTKHLLKSMMVAGAGGRIVNIASIVGQTGYPGLAAYSASKAALLGFTRSLAREVGSLGITVNAVAPGFVETDMTHGLSPKQMEQIKRRSALQRMTTVDDVAGSVAFLISQQAAGITGQVLTVDAGNTV
jgi:3-oxoacyl-[acyl-carrier protein] reductase